MILKELYFQISEEFGLVSEGEIIEKLRDRRPGMYKMKISSTDVRSLEQNAYYWGVVIQKAWEWIVGEGNDWSREQVHLFFKLKFHYTEVFDFQTGEVARVPETTTEMSPLEFFEYVEKIRIYCREVFQIEITEPVKIINYDPSKN